MNKKLFTRVLCLVLLVLTAVSVCACTEGGNKPVETKAPSKTEAPEETHVTPDLPEMTFDGYTFSVAHWELSGMTPKYNDVYVEEDDADPIVTAVYRRDAKLSESLDINFEFEYMAYNEIQALCKTCVNSSDDIYDLIYLRMHETPSPMMEGDFLDFENDFQYIDLDKPYYDQGLRRELSFAEHLFLAASDLNIEDKQDTYALAFNKQIARDSNLGDLYQYVRDGQWTLDKVWELSQAVHHDDNGDSKIDTADDTIGFLGNDDATIAFFFSLGGRFTEKDDFDYPEYCFNDEDIFDRVEAMLDFFYDESACVAGNKTYTMSNGDCFKANRGLFNQITISSVIGWRGEEDLDFGVLPPPYYEEGDDVKCLVSRHHCGIMSVLRCEQDIDTVGYIIEAMSGNSWGLQDAYYDITLKTKAARDDESQEMLDIIFANRTTDIGEVMDFGSFATEILRYVSRNHTFGQLSSTYAGAESKINTAIEKFYDQIEEIDAMRG
ncbi:MAG: hypothetical protein MJ070_08910 [Lachnospiraceae bacterium]|nr:hypothetical protein [Lachnospiraceae bacterium]MCQ2426252.1 hypothetical protein [Lachnospiraceae bacterium]